MASRIRFASALARKRHRHARVLAAQAVRGHRAVALQIGEQRDNR
jgi:hypothetical protein